MRVKLWPQYTASNANKLFIQAQRTHKAIQTTYVLFVHDQRDTRFVHSTNENQRRTVIIIVVYLDSKMVHSWGCIIRDALRPHTASNTYNQHLQVQARTANTDELTSCWFGPIRHPLFHTFSTWKSTQSRHCHRTAKERMSVNCDLILHQLLITQPNASTHRQQFNVHAIHPGPTQHTFHTFKPNEN